MTKKENALFRCAVMILKDECPPDRKYYMCMMGEDDDTHDCTQCWSDYLFGVLNGVIDSDAVLQDRLG